MHKYYLIIVYDIVSRMIQSFSRTILVLVLRLKFLNAIKIAPGHIFIFYLGGSSSTLSVLFLICLRMVLLSLSKL